MSVKGKLGSAWRQLTLMCAVALATFAVATTAFGATLFTYSGSGIWSLPSQKSAYVNGKTCTVNHTQTRAIKQKSQQMQVFVQRKDGLGWSDVGSRTFYNDTSGSFSTYCSAGTYRLYFYSGSAYDKFTISGSFNG